MILVGAKQLEINRAKVDALNVFPVPDGDTGTNMSLTMQSAVRGLPRGSVSRSLQPTSKSPDIAVASILFKAFIVYTFSLIK